MAVFVLSLHSLSDVMPRNIYIYINYVRISKINVFSVEMQS